MRELYKANTLTVAEIAKHYNVSRNTIYHAIKNHQIKCAKTGIVGWCE